MIIGKEINQEHIPQYENLTVWFDKEVGNYLTIAICDVMYSKPFFKTIKFIISTKING